MVRSTKRISRRIRRRVEPIAEFPAEWWTARRLNALPRDEILSEHSAWTEHVAIVATYPRAALSESITRLVKNLRHQNATVIIVANESPDREACTDEWLNLGASIIQRPNLGRDFGAYQRGMQHLLSHGPITSISRVSYFNDSVAYLPTSLMLLREWLGEAEGNLALATTRPKKLRVQGFALSLEGGTAFSQPLRQFWNHYVPSNNRLTVIRRGEQKLSQALRKSPNPTVGYLTFDLLDSALDGDWGKLSDEEAEGLRWAVGFRPQIAKALSSSAHELDVNSPEVRRRIAQEIPNWIGLNRPFGLIAARLFGLPLKLDLVSVGAASSNGVSQLLEHSGIGAAEKQQIVQLMNAHTFGT